jgi:hypothetical protein
MASDWGPFSDNTSECLGRRDDLASDQLQPPGFPDPGHPAVRLGDAERGQALQLREETVDLLSPLADVEAGHDGLLDVVVVAALGIAVRAEDVQLPRDIRRGEQVARLRVPRDQAQGLRLPAAADQDRRRRIGCGELRVRPNR